VNGVENNYKTFQDQEFTEDLGLNMHEFAFRMYDPAIGRFAAIDPVADSYPHNGAYNFSENRVIDGIELEGLEYVSRIHIMDGDEHIRTIDINYYQMTEEQIEAAGGTYKSVSNAASYGPEGKGVKHTYSNKNSTRWDFKDDKTRHGLYSGEGSITDYRGGKNWDFSFQPIDLADAIAKEHDRNYTGFSNYAGYVEDTRTLGADNLMVGKLIVF
jgi:RHS repeat-associated protein